MKIKKRTFGRLYTGQRVDLYLLKAGDLSLAITNYGARWVSLTVPRKAGPSQDILLGLSTLDACTRDAWYFGSTVGRYANRIAGGKFSLGGKEYALDRNDGQNTLHGGRRGFDRRIWKAEPYAEKDGIFLRLELESPDGDMGFPGNCRAVVSYGVTKSNMILADFQAFPDVDSPVSLVNHGYFNLAGEGEGGVLSHEARFQASFYLESGPDGLPEGLPRPVTGGPFDFLQKKTIGRDIGALQGTSGGGGYDHCFAVDGEIDTLRPFAEFCEPRTGRILRVQGTQPGFQFYTGNFLKAVQGKCGSVYGPHAGFCIEAGHFPDSPNRSGYPSAIFGPGRPYHGQTLYSFDW